MSDVVEKVAKAIDIGPFDDWQRAYDARMRHGGNPVEAVAFADWVGRRTVINEAKAKAAAAVRATLEHYRECISYEAVSKGWDVLTQHIDVRPEDRDSDTLDMAFKAMLKAAISELES